MPPMTTYFLVLWIAVQSVAQQQPAIVFDAVTKDLGKVAEGQQLKHVFKFTNKGNGTLEILDVHPG